VWKLPVVFIIENNGYGLSTPVREQFSVDDLSVRGQGYGIKSLSIDGNNLIEVYRTVCALAGRVRESGEPVLLECKTFRMIGHEEASGTKYVPDELFDEWIAKDPIKLYREY